MEKQLNETYFEAILPFPVSVNNMYFLKNAGNGLVLTNEVRAYYNKIKIYIAEIWPYQPIEKRVKVSVWFYENDRRRRDINNYTKTLFDALQGCVYADDKQIDETYLKRCELNEEACVKVVIEIIEEKDTRKPMKQVKAEKIKSEKIKENEKILCSKINNTCAKALEQYKIAVEKQNFLKNENLKKRLLNLKKQEINHEN